jgi:hypothetical protein
MNPSNQKETDELIKDETERDKIGKFERQFRDLNDSSRLRADLKVEEVFEKAGYKPMEWMDLSPQMKSWITSSRAGKGAYGVSLRPWEEGLGHMIFGKPEEGAYYLLRKTGKNYAWSRFWLDGETPRFEPLNHDSSLSEVIGTVAYHEFGEESVSVMGNHSKGEAMDLSGPQPISEEQRKKIGRTLARPWEK